MENQGVLTAAAQEALERDWRESDEMVLICRRPDGTIAIHKWGMDDDDQACVLAMEAFNYNMRPLFETKRPVSISSYKKVKHESKAT